MDTVRKLMKSWKNEKGMAVVWLAVIIVVCIAFVGLAVDMGYMYVAKGQLQNAADAAALAGVAKLTQAGASDLIQSTARVEAIAFANKNNAAGESVQMLNDNSNTLSDANDITVGNWNGSSYARGVTPVNAVEVSVRRSASSNSLIKPVQVFFGKILALGGGADWSQMSVKASAIAAKVVRGNAPITLCVQACPKTGGLPVDGTLEWAYPPGHLMYFAPFPSELLPSDQGAQGIAWTVFSTTSQSMDKGVVESYFCGNKMDSCALPPIYTTNANDNDLQRAFFCAFKNPNYYSSDKQCSDGDGTCGPVPPAGSNVISWVVTVPILENAGCPPGSQPYPYQVVKYAQIRVRDVYASGAGANNCACDAYSLKSPTGSFPNAIVIDRITCVTCGNSGLYGNTPVLVEDKYR